MELNSEKLALKIVQILDDKKAKDIEVLDISNVSLLADYFVICSGNSTTQIKALADEVEEKLAELGYIPIHKEGYSSSSWILLDYGEIVVHIFHYESRSFYNLEHLWSDARSVDIQAIIN
ncbi:MAG: ribosome-associated protein [Clostridiales bacterium]|nr:ribosome-associated protein [Clostridiales bacterium]